MAQRDVTQAMDLLNTGEFVYLRNGRRVVKAEQGEDRLRISFEGSVEELFLELKLEKEQFAFSGNPCYHISSPQFLGGMTIPVNNAFHHPTRWNEAVEQHAADIIDRLVGTSWDRLKDIRLEGEEAVICIDDRSVRIRVHQAEDDPLYINDAGELVPVGPDYLHGQSSYELKQEIIAQFRALAAAFR